MEKTVGRVRIESHVEDRMRVLARRMLGQFPAVRRWDETDDILQESALRLHRALQQVTPESELHLHRLAALQIRRVLLNLSERYAGKSCFAANHETGYEAAVSGAADRAWRQNGGPSMSLDDWASFHRVAATLPPAQRDVVDLLWYQELREEDAARLLEISKRTLQRRWRTAKRELMRRLDNALPE